MSGRNLKTETMEKICNFEVYRLDETSSTNDEVRRRMKESTAGSVVVTAEFQTAGRGQKGNHWESDAGRNLLYSMGLRPRGVPAGEAFILLQTASLAVVRALDRFAGGMTIKWPNDIYWHDRKLSGTLIENELRGRCVAASIIGTGINVNQKTFRSDAPNPVSLFQICGHETSVDALFRAVLEEFGALYGALREGRAETIRQEYLARLYRRTGRHAYRDSGGGFEAEIETVEPDGHLILRTADGGRRRYAFKEVKYVLPQLSFD
jgi:BirA family biotin operon repressor/biotin-[acetyl-CoA-carboxylase] ligase